MTERDQRPAEPTITAAGPEPIGSPDAAGNGRIRLDLAYDGTDFSGWARQPGRRTVCGVVEDALALVVGVPLALTVAGRTDAGVHATGQVAHADLPGGCDHDELVRRLARLLPPDVRVRRIVAVPAAFDARFSALRRHYTYRIATARYGVEPLRARDTLAWPHPVDLAMMRAAAAELIGERDFAAFCRRREGATTRRELQRFSWTELPDGVLLAEVTADAFCHGMVRSLVGALLDVGRGVRPVGWPLTLSAQRTRANEVVVAPAHGLTLTRVDYPPDDQLAARAEATRRLRVGPIAQRGPAVP